MPRGSTWTRVGISRCAHTTIPAPIPPRQTMSRMPSSWVWPPSTYRTSSATPDTERGREQEQNGALGGAFAHSVPLHAGVRVVGRAVDGRPERARATNRLSPMTTATNPSLTGPNPPIGTPPGDGLFRRNRT